MQQDEWQTEGPGAAEANSMLVIRHRNRWDTMPMLTAAGRLAEAGVLDIYRMLEMNMPTAQIADITGLSKTTIRYCRDGEIHKRRYHQYDRARRRPHRRRGRQPAPRSEWSFRVQRLYEEDGMTVRQIADATGRDYVDVYAELRRRSPLFIQNRKT